jgi:predicted tellurium resistance membrane protein TerC
MVFSLDSVLTAVGMVDIERYSARWIPLTIMITAVLVAIAVMLAFSGPVARFVNRHPSVKMLALAFLILIGVVLVAESFHTHIPRGYIYSAMCFSLFVELLNLRARSVGQKTARKA